MVHQQGTQLVDQSGKPLKLRGVNLGGWLLWEGWIWGGGLVSESQILSRLQASIGPKATEQFQQRIYDTFITEQDIMLIASLHMNVVRVPIHYRIFEDDNNPKVYKQSGFAIIDRLLGWCEKYGVYVVLDLHAAPGGQSRFFVADPAPNDSLWTSQSNKDRTVALWQALATHYKDRTIIAGYDLLNEPDPPNGSDLVALYQRIIAAIRQVDSFHMVILEGGSAARDFSMFSGPLSNNQAYSFHMYTWFGDNRQKQLDTYQTLSKQQGVPIWCGEFGENTYKILQTTVQMFDDPGSGVSGWAFWTWKKVPNARNKYPSLTTYPVSDGWKQLMTAASERSAASALPADDTVKDTTDFINLLQRSKPVLDPELARILTPSQ